MKHFRLILFLTLISTGLSGQTKAELESTRKKTLEEIAYVDNLLQTTAREKSESMNAVKIIGSKVILRESVISGMRQEISLVNERISLNTLAIEMMEKDLIALKEDYARAVTNSYRQKKGNPDLVYILSARDFNQGYKRLKYLQQVTKFRRRESEIILELKSQIESSKLKLQNDLYRLSDLKSKEEQQKSLLLSEQQKKQRMVKSLSNREKQLRKDLDEKKRIAQKIEKEIARLIEEERKKAVKTDITPEQKLIGENFAENKGRLPWPVEKGIITSSFGVHQNAVLKNVTEENIGIEITSSGKTSARSVFQGEVARIFAITGANMTVIIRHGKYYSVYTNLVNVKVKTGDKVATKQEIGDVYADPGNSNNAILKFMIVETKYQDPESWIAKK
ncbi:MAG: peptidoglycan DD-metalloendopeptidase family protein [Bacteroidales bacterium]|nr:peptidoglycan DD-metalloendopeptidase family protein [Bacteroidales bacterium]MBK7625937.1 peptidoglycan DD-metalloendopeptidase family protein [Bacteroidales bacterium]